MNMEEFKNAIENKEDVYNYHGFLNLSSRRTSELLSLSLLQLKKTSLKKLLSVVKNEPVICTGTWGQANAGTGCLFAAAMPQKYWKDQEKAITADWEEHKSWDNLEDYSQDDFINWFADYEIDPEMDIVNHFKDDRSAINNVIACYDQWSKSYTKTAKVGGFTLNGEKGMAKFDVKALNARGRARLALKIQEALNAK